MASSAVILKPMPRCLIRSTIFCELAPPMSRSVTSSAVKGLSAARETGRLTTSKVRRIRIKDLKIAFRTTSPVPVKISSPSEGSLPLARVWEALAGLYADRIGPLHLKPAVGLRCESSGRGAGS